MFPPIVASENQEKLLDIIYMPDLIPEGGPNVVTQTAYCGFITNVMDIILANHYVFLPHQQFENSIISKQGQFIFFQLALWDQTKYLIR